MSGGDKSRYVGAVQATLDSSDPRRGQTVANDRSISLAGHDVSTKTLNEVVCNRTSLHSTRLLLFYLFSRLPSFPSLFFFLLYLILFACWLTTRRLARIGQGSSSSRQESPVPTGRGPRLGTEPVIHRHSLLGQGSPGVCILGAERCVCVTISGICARVLPAMPATHPSLSVLYLLPHSGAFTTHLHGSPVCLHFEACYSSAHWQAPRL